MSGTVRHLTFTVTLKAPATLEPLHVLEAIRDGVVGKLARQPHSSPLGRLDLNTVAVRYQPGASAEDPARENPAPTQGNSE